MTGALRAIDRALDGTGVLIARFARPVRDGLIVVGLARAAYYFFVQGIQPWTFIGVDARAYWQVDLAHPYVGSGVGRRAPPTSTRRRSPRSWRRSRCCLSRSSTRSGSPCSSSSCAWLIRPWPWAALILFLPVSYELLVGNVHFLIAAAIVLGFPGARQRGRSRS